MMQGANEQKRIVLALPGRLFRDGIESLIQSPSRIIVNSWGSLDEFDDTSQAQNTPDVVITNVGCGWTEGIAKIRALRMLFPATRWILLSADGAVDVVRASLDIGVNGLVLENSPGEVLKLVVELVLLDHTYISVELAKLVIDTPHQAGPSDPGTGAGEGRNNSDPPDHGTYSRPYSGLGLPKSDHLIGRTHSSTDIGNATAGCRADISLSDREVQILACLSEGAPNKLIARDLQIAEATVKVHVKALLRKMKLSNRTQAAIAAPLFLSASRPYALKMGNSDAPAAIVTNLGVTSGRPDKISLSPYSTAS